MNATGITRNQSGAQLVFATAEPGRHTLPDLPYAYDALEPHIDANTMLPHHSIHHQGYVNGLNEAELGLVEARASNNFATIAKLERALAFHGSGHNNHLIFWQNMNAAELAKETPTGALAAQIQRDFGSLDNLKAQFNAAAASVEGNGWGALVYHPIFQRLYVTSLLNHQNLTLVGSIPLLLLDVWEHAYYLKYQNRRAEYIKNWWKVVDWSDVERRFEAAANFGA